MQYTIGRALQLNDDDRRVLTGVYAEMLEMSPRIFLPKRFEAILETDQVLDQKLTACLIMIGWKLSRPEWETPACVGEEICMYLLMQNADNALTSDGIDTLANDAMEDDDVAFLWEPEYDGIDQSEVGKRHGMSSLNMSDWWTPFTDREVHPFVALTYADADE